jgi:2-hydroxychromene-2-carboxylate isomerase
VGLPALRAAVAGEASGALRFYFDYLSSNAYLAWTQVHPLAERFGRAVEPVPVLFAGLLGRYGQLGPAEVPPKAWWMAKNNLRKAAALGVPLNPPVHHPFNPLLALRVSSLPLPDADRRRLIDALFRAVWVDGLHVSEPAVVQEIAERLGLPGRRLLADATQPEAKQRLRQQTDDALAAGVFGVPTVIADGELFFGFDDFPWLERFLAGEDPLDPEELAKWTRGLTPSAVRRRP